MLDLLSLSYKSLVSSATRWLLALLAIAFGVTGIVASLSINNALTTSLNNTSRALLGDADAEIVAMGEGGFTSQTLAALDGISSIQIASPRVTKLTYYEVGATSRGFLQLTGIDPALDTQLHPQILLAGSPLGSGTDSGVLVPELWASGLGLNVGDMVRLITAEGFKDFPITGLLGGTTNLLVGDHPAAFVNLADMGRYFALGARADEVSIRYQPGQGAAAAASIAGAVSEPYLLRDLAAVEAGLINDQRDFRWLLTLFGVVAIVAGGVEILNTLSILAHRRTRELGLLRAAGATRSQVSTILLLEALLIGIAGSIIGLLLGWLLAGLLSGLVQAGRGLGINVGLDLNAAVTGLLAGMLVAVLAAIVPAWNLARREPLDSLRPEATAQPATRSYVIPALISLALLVAFGAVVWSLLGSDTSTRPEFLLAGFALLLFLGLILILMALVPVLIALAGFLLRSSGSGLALLAQRSLRWRSGRTALTASALTIAVTLLTTLLVLASSAASAGNRTLEVLFAAPYVVVAPVAQPSGFIAVIQQESGAAKVSPLRKVTLSWDNRFVDAVGIEPTFYAEDATSLPLVRGDRMAALNALQAGDAVLVPEDYARHYALVIGSVLNIWTPNGGPKPYTVSGLLARSFPANDPAGALVLSIASLRTNFGVDSFTQLLVRPDSGADFGPRLNAVAERYGLQAQSTDQLADDINRSITQTLLLFGALTGTAALVGALSIINAMSLNVLERAPVIGLMRAAGMSSSQVSTSVLLEAGLLGAVAGFLGVLLGSGVGLMLFGAGRISQSAVFTVPWWILLLVPITALLAIAAAILPARQAASTGILHAVRSRT